MGDAIYVIGPAAFVDRIAAQNPDARIVSFWSHSCGVFIDDPDRQLRIWDGPLPNEPLLRERILDWVRCDVCLRFSQQASERGVAMLRAAGLIGADDE